MKHEIDGAKHATEPPLAPISEPNRKKLEGILRDCGLTLKAVA